MHAMLRLVVSLSAKFFERIIRFHLLSKLIDKQYIFDTEELKAISDGLNFNNRTPCSDIIDLKTLSLNYIFSTFPIFTPNIGFDSKELQNIRTKISKNIKEIKYCDFTPNNQVFNENYLIEIYNSLDKNEIIERLIKSSQKIEIK